MSDGRTKDWWIGYALGITDILSIRKDIPEDVRKMLTAASNDFKEWEMRNKG